MLTPNLNSDFPFFRTLMPISTLKGRRGAKLEIKRLLHYLVVSFGINGGEFENEVKNSISRGQVPHIT